MTVNGAFWVFAAILLAGVALDLIGRHTRWHCPTISDIAGYVRRRRYGGWILFVMWAAVGWHFFVQ